VDPNAAVRFHLDVTIREHRQELQRHLFECVCRSTAIVFFLEWHSRTEIAITEALYMLDHCHPWKFAFDLQEGRNPRSTDLNVLLSVQENLRFSKCPSTPEVAGWKAELTSLPNWQVE
jgi:hypothetical protein